METVDPIKVEDLIDLSKTISSKINAATQNGASESEKKIIYRPLKDALATLPAKIHMSLSEIKLLCTLEPCNHTETMLYLM